MNDIPQVRSRAWIDPDRFGAVLFDLDGVITDTARAHARAWTKTFDPFLEVWSRRDGVPFSPFTPQDYLAYVDGRPREDGIRAFLAARRIALPDGQPSDGPDQQTIRGLGAGKNAHFLAELRDQGVEVDPAAVPLIEALRRAGLRLGLVTSSRNGAEVLKIAGLEGRFDTVMDGSDQQELGLAGKPAPDAFVEAAKRIGIDPERTVVVEDAVAGVAAAHAGGFGLVIGIDDGRQADALTKAGADRIVADLSHVNVGAGESGGRTFLAQEDVQRLDPFGWRGAAPGATETGWEGQDGWLFECDRYEPALQGRRETLFAVGNGHFVTRGAAAEAKAGGVHYPGTYVAGGYNRLVTETDGRPIEHEDLVNLPNWLPFNFRAEDGDWLDLERDALLSFRQTIDLRRGIYNRTIRVSDAGGRITRIEERRFVSMADRHLAAQHVALIPENWSGALVLRAGIDGDVSNAGVQRYRPFDGAHIAVREARAADRDTLFVDAETSQSQLRVTMAARLRVHVDGEPRNAERTLRLDGKAAVQEIAVQAQAGECVGLEKVVALYTSRDRAIADTGAAAAKALRRAGPFDALLRAHALAWAQLWRRCDVTIELDDAESSRRTQVALRLHIFHLLQTISPHTAESDAGVPARGWHGEGYRGHVFWDELFVFPFLSLRTPALARALLLYRYRRLPEARWAAQEAGYRGAMFPWQSGSDGREETDAIFLNPRSGNWIEDHTHLQRHVGAAIAYTVWSYFQATGDTAFLRTYAAELLLEIARFWASIAQWNPQRGRYDIKNVIGPDEFHDRYPGREAPGLDNNAYTNVMASWCLTRALDLLDQLPDARRRSLCEQLKIEPEEIRAWEEISRLIYLPFNRDGILDQFEGYDRLEEFPWATYRARYGNIMRLDLILEAEGVPISRYKLSKQADVLMLFYLFSAEEMSAIFERLGYPFDPASIPRTIDYYLQRTSHGSTLSGIVHAWVLARSCRQRSWKLFTEALRSDIDDIQGGTTAEGIHLGAMAGTVDLLQRCYTGIELRDGRLHFNPALSSELSRLSFRLQFRRQMLSVALTQSQITVGSDPDGDNVVPIVLAGRPVDLKPGSTRSAPLAGKASFPASAIGREDDLP